MQISGGVQVSGAFQALIGLPLIAIWGRSFCVEKFLADVRKKNVVAKEKIASIDHNRRSLGMMGINGSGTGRVYG
jgi:hypothetical protein